MDSVVGFGPQDHLCLAFDDVADFASQAEAFLADGLAQGLQVRYVTAGPVDEATAVHQRLVEAQPPGREHAVQVSSIAGSYGLGQLISADEQVETYAKCTSNALTAGFVGFRVAVDVTPLVGTAEQLDSFARYEHLIDRYMCGHPFSAMCAYDRKALGADAVAEAACMHPVSNAATMFRWHAGCTPRSGPVAVDVALVGEVDASVRSLFQRAIHRTAVTPGQAIVLDLASLDFIDHHALTELDTLGRHHGTAVVLRNPGYLVTRIVRLMNLTHVSVGGPA